MGYDPLIVNAIVALISAVLGASGLWTLIGKRIDKKLEKSQDREKERAMLVGIAHDRIVWLGMQYIERGWLTHDEYENLDLYLFKPYENLGGNGSAAKIMAEVRKLPLHKDKDWRKRNGSQQQSV